MPKATKKELTLENLLAQLKEMEKQLEVLRKENEELRKAKAGISGEIIKQALVRMEQALGVKVAKYISENTTIAVKTSEGFYSIGSLNMVQKRIYLKQKLTKNDVELLYKLARQD